MIGIKTADGMTLQVDQAAANMMTLLQVALQNNPTGLVEMQEIKAADFMKILDFCKHHSYVNPPPIRRPIPNGDLSCCIPDKFDVEYIYGFSFEQIFDLIRVCEYLGLPALKELAL